MPDKLVAEVAEKLALFAGINADDRNSMLQEGRLRYVTRGEYLFHNGDPVSRFYIVCSGSMRLTRETPDGKELTTDITCRGKTIGKFDILKSFRHHSTGACAIDDAVVLEFPSIWLKNIVRNPIIALNILSSTSQYVHMLEIESEQKSTMGVAQRIGCFLQRLCVMYDLDPRGFELPYSKALIASRLGMEPETFSRGLATLGQRGIKVNNARITISDIEALGDFVCDHCSLAGECVTHRKLADGLS